jgi:predicted  nucleic acid-binding Zn-ribbon protein
MDEIKDSIKAISSAIESMDSKHNQMQEDLNLIKNEFYVANLRSFPSKVKDAFVRLQAAVDALADANDDAVYYHTW